jgi:hypothetical protein
MSILTQERFDEVVSHLATKEDVRNSTDELLFRISDAMATVEEGLAPEERLALIEQKLSRIQQIMHDEL